jgi:hypothetical protein
MDPLVLTVFGFVLFVVDAVWHRSLTAAGLAFLTATLLF